MVTFQILRNQYHKLIITSKKQHSPINLVSSVSDNPKRLLQTVNKQLHHKSSSPLGLLSSSSGTCLASNFANVFMDKLSNLRISFTSNASTSSPHSSSHQQQLVMNSAARVVSNTRKFDSGLSRRLRDELHCIDVTDRIQARRAGVPMSSWNSSAVPDKQLHTNSRRRRSSTSFCCQPVSES